MKREVEYLGETEVDGGNVRAALVQRLTHHL